MRCPRLLIYFLLILLAPFESMAQDEFLATLDYYNLTVNRIGNIPGVTRISGNSTYDANHQRVFFMGLTSPIAIRQLFTIDALTSATIYSPIAPAGNIGGGIYGLQYDNAHDTLYAINTGANGKAYFVWLEPATGIVHIKQSIPGFKGYNESSFDSNDHLYIVNGGGAVMVIDAETGTVVHNFSNPPIFNMIFDNLNGRLYGIGYTGAAPQFDSVSLSTGAVYPLSSLPPMQYSPIWAYTIDEQSGKFIVVSGNPTSPTCILKTIYVLDVQTGTVLSQTPYPFAQNTSALNAENVVEYSFDNKKGILYALNWFPANANLPLTISASPPLCTGSAETFTATVWTGFSNPSYQWQVNGTNVGANKAVFSSSTLSNGDSVRCIFTGQSSCALSDQDTSNSIAAMSGPPAANASVRTVASAAVICSNQQDSFVAHTFNAGPSPTYQWQLNGYNVGANDSVFITRSLANGDSVRCLITTNSACVLPGPDTSNVIVLQVSSVNSSVSITSSSSTICNGDTVVFTASAVNGGPSPAFQWQVNGAPVATNSDSLITSSLLNGDVVNCVLTSSISCTVPIPSANSITMTVSSAPSISFDPDTLIIKPGEKAMLAPVIVGDIGSFLWAPATSLDNALEMAPFAAPQLTTTYQLTVTSTGGCRASGKETVFVYSALGMPTAFTPNGDGKNDVFRIPTSTPQVIKSFAIFNRWGEMVFSAPNSNTGWDGDFKGHPQPAGTYVWEIAYEDLLLKRTTRIKGVVLLIR